MLIDKAKVGRVSVTRHASLCFFCPMLGVYSWLRKLCLTFRFIGVSPLLHNNGFTLYELHTYSKFHAYLELHTYSELHTFSQFGPAKGNV